MPRFSNPARTPADQPLADGWRLAPAFVGGTCMPARAMRRRARRPPGPLRYEPTGPASARSTRAQRRAPRTCRGLPRCRLRRLRRRALPASGQGAAAGRSGATGRSRRRLIRSARVERAAGSDRRQRSGPPSVRPRAPEMAVAVASTRSGRQRAAGTPANGDTTVGAMNDATPRRPVAAAPPALYATTRFVTRYAHWPALTAIQLAWRRRRSGSLSAARMTSGVRPSRAEGDAMSRG